MRFRQNEAWLDGCGASDELDDWYGGAWFCVVLREGDGVRARVGGMMPSWARRALQNLLVRFVRACWGVLGCLVGELLFVYCLLFEAVGRCGVILLGTAAQWSIDHAGGCMYAHALRVPASLVTSERHFRVPRG